MAQAPYDAQVLEAALALVSEHGSVSAAARASGIPAGTLQHRYRRAKTWKEAQKPFTTPDLPSELPDAKELLERRSKEFARVDAARSARGLIPIAVNIDGPFGIAHFGDPHVDDPGCDIVALQRDIRTVNKTPGLFAGNVGDYNNNWIGRLAALHAQQSTTAQEAWVLVEWLFQAAQWIYLVGGNHDAWSGDRDPLYWIARQQNALYEPHGARLGLQTPSGRVFRVNARHDFKGHSMWNTAHGIAKAVQMGWRDHVATAGHTHVSGYQVLKCPATGLISHALRIATYKIHDHYAVQMGFPNQNIFNCPVTIFDPRYADDDRRCITTIFDVEAGADYLTWLRKKAKAA
jgi:hypothetical protein